MDQQVAEGALIDSEKKKKKDKKEKDKKDKEKKEKKKKDRKEKRSEKKTSPSTPANNSPSDEGSTKKSKKRKKSRSGEDPLSQLTQADPIITPDTDADSKPQTANGNTDPPTVTVKSSQPVRRKKRATTVTSATSVQPISTKMSSIAELCRELSLLKGQEKMVMDELAKEFLDISARMSSVPDHPPPPPEDTLYKKKQKKIVDPLKPKRPQSAYILWSSANRQAIKDKNPGSNPKELMGVIAAEWKTLDSAQKLKWETDAAAAKIQHQKEMDEYMKNKEADLGCTQESGEATTEATGEATTEATTEI